jgi:hypothetical protein
LLGHGDCSHCKTIVGLLPLKGNSARNLNLLKMKKNMGTADRIIRIIIAAIIVFLYFTGTISGTLGIILLALAGVFVLTSLVSFCPLYAPFGIKTCSVNSK